MKVTEHVHDLGKKSRNVTSFLRKLGERFLQNIEYDHTINQRPIIGI